MDTSVYYGVPGTRLAALLFASSIFFLKVESLTKTILITSTRRLKFACQLFLKMNCINKNPHVTVKRPPI